MKRILAIDTSTSWCSVALSLGDGKVVLRHEPVQTGASQVLLPWIAELLEEMQCSLAALDAIAVGIGPGAFTGVRLGIAAVQGLAVSHHLPVIPVASLDAIALQLVMTDQFKLAAPKHFVIAIDARMDEIYWAQYQAHGNAMPKRLGDIHLSKPEELILSDITYLGGSAIHEYGERLFASQQPTSSHFGLDADIGISALGILDCAKQYLKEGRQIEVHQLEPLYVRNKVALTTQERIHQQSR